MFKLSKHLVPSDSIFWAGSQLHGRPVKLGSNDYTIPATNPVRGAMKQEGIQFSSSSRGATNKSYHGPLTPARLTHSSLPLAHLPKPASITVDWLQKRWSCKESLGLWSIGHRTVEAFFTRQILFSDVIALDGGKLITRKVDSHCRDVGETPVCLQCNAASPFWHPPIDQFTTTVSYGTHHSRQPTSAL